MTFKSGKFSWRGGRTDTDAARTAFVLKGVVQTLIGLGVGWELATQAEAETGTDAYKVITPATLKAVIDSRFESTFAEAACVRRRLDRIEKLLEG